MRDVWRMFDEARHEALRCLRAVDEAAIAAGDGCESHAREAFAADGFDVWGDDSGLDAYLRYGEAMKSAWSGSHFRESIRSAASGKGAAGMADAAEAYAGDLRGSLAGLAEVAAWARAGGHSHVAALAEEKSGLVGAVLAELQGKD